MPLRPQNIISGAQNPSKIALGHNSLDTNHENGSSILKKYNPSFPFTYIFVMTSRLKMFFTQCVKLYNQFNRKSNTQGHLSDLFFEIAVLFYYNLIVLKIYSSLQRSAPFFNIRNYIQMEIWTTLGGVNPHLLGGFSAIWWIPKLNPKSIPHA